MLWWTVFGWIVFIWTFGLTRGQEDLDELLESTRRLVNYYKNQFENMNLDGIYGLRVLEGQTQLILQRSPNLDTVMHSFLTNINHEAHNISEMSLSFLKQNDGEYYTKLHPLVAKPLLIAENYRLIDPKLRWPRKSDGQHKEISEAKSDECITNLLGSDTTPQCRMPKDCLDLFTEPGYADYSLTHQVLYTLVAQQCGCTEQFENYLLNKGYSGGLAELRLEFCTNVFYDAASLVQKLNKNLRPITQDLFMEQVFACGVMGFMEFVHVDWLRQLVTWQKPNGCFGAMPRQTDMNDQPKDMDYHYLDDKLEEVNRNGKQFDEIYDDDNNNKNEQNVNNLPQFGVNNVDTVGNNAVDKNNNRQSAAVQWQRSHQNIMQPNSIDWKGDPFIQKLANQPIVYPMQQVNHRKNMYPIIEAQHQEQEQTFNKLPVQPAAQLNPSLFKHDRLMEPMSQQQDMVKQFIQGKNTNLQPQTGQHIQPAEVPMVPPARLAANIQKAVVQHNIGSRNLLYVHVQASNDSITDLRLLTDTNYKTDVDHLAIGRKLLVEKSLEGGCLAHKTAVAAGMLSQYLRFFLDPGPPEYHSVVQVDGFNHMMALLPGETYTGQGGQVPTDLNHPQQQLRTTTKNIMSPDKSKHYPGDNEDKPQAYYNDDDDDAGNGNDDRDDDGDDDADGDDDDNDDDEDDQNYLNNGAAPPPDNGDMVYGRQEGKENRQDDKVYMDEKKDSVFYQKEADVINPKHKPSLHKADDRGANNYPYYYDERDEKIKDKEINKQASIKERVKVPTQSLDIIAAVKTSEKRSDSGVSVGTSYAVILLVMVLLLYYMNKFVRRRRVLIKYR